jgi:NADPH-dependent curcumin reductase CurA
LTNFGVGKVLRSDSGEVKAGDYVYGIFGLICVTSHGFAALTFSADFAEYQIKTDAGSVRVLRNEEKLPWSVYVGVAGMPG